LGCLPGISAPPGTRVVLEGLPLDVPVVTGAFAPRGLPSSRYVIAASAPGHLSNTVTVDVPRASSSREVTVSTVLCLQDVSADRVVVTGRVVTAPNDQGLSVPDLGHGHHGRTSWRARRLPRRDVTRIHAFGQGAGHLRV